MRPWAPGSGPCGPRTKAERATDGSGGSGYTDRPAGFLASDLQFQAAGSLLALPSSLGFCSASGVLRASVMRVLPASFVLAPEGCGVLWRAWPGGAAARPCPGPGGGLMGQKRKVAVWVLPSVSLRVSCWQVPWKAVGVFQA
jgi:hypothetical protein